MLGAILPLFGLLALASCGEAPETTVGGTGIGPVSGFSPGSAAEIVIVNGVKYNVDNAAFVDAHGRTLDNLAAGMVVKVTAGRIDDNPTSPNGVAVKMEIFRLADGPVDDNSVSFDNNSFRVLRQTVFVNPATVFDNVADLFAIDNLVRQGNRPELEIHGSTDDTGSLRAGYVHLWTDNLVSGREVQLRGTVRNLNRTDNTFAVGPLLQKVDYTAVPSVPAGLGDGAFLEVRGTYRVADNTILGRNIRLEDPAAGQASGDLAKAEGYVTRILPDTIISRRFELIAPDGFRTVNWSTGTFGLFRNGSEEDLKVGAKVQVEGSRNQDNTVAAKRITFRKPCNYLLEGTALVPTSGTLRIFGLTVAVDALTQYKDSSAANERTFGIQDILPGDTLRVAAFPDDSVSSKKLLAASVERIRPVAANRQVLQGFVDSKVQLTGILITRGLQVLTTAGFTSFLLPDNTAFPGSGIVQQANFFDNVIEGSSVVRAQGTVPGATIPMNANEVRIVPVAAK
ncbi:MAG TPA: DUF5666 domain-containing protein [Candidatus Deferrimicrobiaceae bacterium]